MDDVILVNKKDKVLGIVSRKEAHQKGLPHRVSVIYLYDSKGQILVQHRFDGRLDHSSAGHVDPGETYLEAAKRELFEELGIKNIPLEEFAKAINEEVKVNGDHVSHLYTLYKVKAAPKKVNKREIKDVYWAKPEDVLKDMEKDKKNVKYTNGFKVSIKHFMENSMKATAIAPSNIAFTKYWGRKDEKLRLPENGSVSMSLSNLLTTTTVEFSKDFTKDQVIIDGKEIKEEVERTIKHLDRIRKMANIEYKAKVVSNNNFPSSTGLSSSSSGFAALTVAASKAVGLNLSEKQLSILARIGSGAACRSIPGGFVEWLDGNTSDTSYAKTIYPPNHWDICDVVAIVSEHKKEVPTSEGHAKSHSSPFLQTRLSYMKKKNILVKKLIKQRNFKDFGELLESEALELHAIMLTQRPHLIYWTPGTLRIMKLVSHWRKEGIEVYFTINTGQDIHLLCEAKDIDKVKNKLKKLDFVKNIIVNTPGEGARLTQKNLF